MTTKPVDGLTKMREPFPENQIGKLPKPTKAQTDAVKDDYKKGIRCKMCGQWHHPDVVHLDYVGHAAVTDRLLDADPGWTWEPLAIENGVPKLDSAGGLWIKLTVCGVTRMGYGDAAVSTQKASGDLMKERIGDAIRNAAMRFGAGLELWHKGELHVSHDDETDPEEGAKPVSVVGASNANGWDIPALEAFEAILDRAYAAFKAARQTVEFYNEFAAKWKECRKTNAPGETLAKIEKVVKKLEDAAAKKAEDLGLSA